MNDGGPLSGTPSPAGSDPEATSGVVAKDIAEPEPPPSSRRTDEYRREAVQTVKKGKTSTLTQERKIVIPSREARTVKVKHEDVPGLAEALEQERRERAERLADPGWHSDSGAAPRGDPAAAPGADLGAAPRADLGAAPSADAPAPAAAAPEPPISSPAPVSLDPPPAPAPAPTPWPVKEEPVGTAWIDDPVSFDEDSVGAPGDDPALAAMAAPRRARWPWLLLLVCAGGIAAASFVVLDGRLPGAEPPRAAVEAPAAASDAPRPAAPEPAEESPAQPASAPPPPAPSAIASAPEPRRPTPVPFRPRPVEKKPPEPFLPGSKPKF